MPSLAGAFFGVRFLYILVLNLAPRTKVGRNVEKYAKKCTTVLLNKNKQYINTISK